MKLEVAIAYAHRALKTQDGFASTPELRDALSVVGELLKVVRGPDGVVVQQALHGARMVVLQKQANTIKAAIQRVDYSEYPDKEKLSSLHEERRSIEAKIAALVAEAASP